MTNEEMQKAMEFIVAQEARSPAKIDDALTEPRTALKKGGREPRKASALCWLTYASVPDCNRGDSYD